MNAHKWQEITATERLQYLQN